jgi:hypothetical protein
MDRPELCALLPGRTWARIGRQACTLGLKRHPPVQKKYSSRLTYSEEEDQVIRDYQAYRITREEMLKRLPTRTEGSVMRRVNELGFRKRPNRAQWQLVKSVQPGDNEGGGDYQENWQQSGGIATLEVETNADCSKINLFRSRA